MMQARHVRKALGARKLKKRGSKQYYPPPFVFLHTPCRFFLRALPRLTAVEKSSTVAICVETMQAFHRVLNRSR
jgi:hypothetical protein